MSDIPTSNAEPVEEKANKDDDELDALLDGS